MVTTLKIYINNFPMLSIVFDLCVVSPYINNSEIESVNFHGVSGIRQCQCMQQETYVFRVM